MAYSFFDRFPWSNKQSLNLDWLLQEMKKLAEYVEQYTALNTVSYSGIWDITKQYPQWSVVTVNNTETYLSRQPVPVGVPIENSEYWIKLADLDPLVAATAAKLANLKIANVVDFYDGDWSTAFDAAFAYGGIVYAPPGVYDLQAPLAISGAYKCFYAAAGSFLRYQGAECALKISGNDHIIQICGEIIAPNAPWVVKYGTLRTSNIYIGVIGGVDTGAPTSGLIWHDANMDAGPCGNNRWTIMRAEAHQADYGVKIDSSAWLYEGDLWDVKVIFSAEKSAFVVGSSGHNTVRFNTFIYCPDAQAHDMNVLTCNNDRNTFHIGPWACRTSPTIVFNNCEGNDLFMERGTSENVEVESNGKNTYNIPGLAGQRKIGGTFTVNVAETGGTETAFTIANDPRINDGAAGSYPLAIENSSSANTAEKYVGILFRSRDTVGAGKSVGAFVYSPSDGNVTNTKMQIMAALQNNLVLAAEISPETYKFARQFTPQALNSHEIGTMCVDDNYIYVMASGGQWKKVALVNV